MKQDIDNLLAMSFIQPMEEATWLPPIVVMPKKMGSFKSMWTSKLNSTTKKDPFPLPFTN
jgi:hypothetical protein